MPSVKALWGFRIARQQTRMAQSEAECSEAETSRHLRVVVMTAVWACQEPHFISNLIENRRSLGERKISPGAELVEEKGRAENAKGFANLCGDGLRVECDFDHNYCTRLGCIITLYGAACCWTVELQ